ncbi:MAG: UDP-N-acetylmuramate dehydrogenase [Chlamydiota bacterium]
MSLPEFFQHNVDLRPYTTYRIGGAAKYLAAAENLEDLRIAVDFCHSKGEKYIILGKGSNCLFDDRGYDGVVILNKLRFYAVQENIFRVGAGYSFAKLGALTAASNMKGLEYAATVPGTVGGAIRMNAGAYGQQAFDTLSKVEFLNEQGELEEYCGEQLIAGYRTSMFKSLKGVIVAAEFELARCSQAEERQQAMIAKRRAAQPIGQRCAGSVFKNPPGSYAAMMIERCGLKGVRVGDAQVSEQHANFIINLGCARAADVLLLIERVRQKVYDEYQIFLELEMRHISY